MPGRFGSTHGASRLNTLLGYFDLELSARAVKSESVKKELIKIARQFQRSVVQHAQTYPDVASKLDNVLSSYEPKVRTNTTGFDNFIQGTTARAGAKYNAKITIRQFSTRKLDQRMPVQVKRGATGSRERFSRLRHDSSLGWWRYFEFGGGIGSRSWGSMKFVFLPSSRARKGKGGRMVKLSELESKLGADGWNDGDKRYSIIDPDRARNILNKKRALRSEKKNTHPGVKRLAMFYQAFREIEKVYQREIQKIIIRAKKELPASEIQIAAKRTVARYGRVSDYIEQYIKNDRMTFAERRKLKREGGPKYQRPPGGWTKIRSNIVDEFEAFSRDVGEYYYRTRGKSTIFAHWDPEEARATILATIFPKYDKSGKYILRIPNSGIEKEYSSESSARTAVIRILTAEDLKQRGIQRGGRRK